MGPKRKAFYLFWVEFMVDLFWQNFFRKDLQESLVLEKLKDCYLFQGLTRRETKFLRSNVHIRDYKPGEFIFKQGDLGVGMYIIIKGSINIFVEDRSSEEPEPQIIAKLNDGDFFGEAALVDSNEKRTASAIAQDQVRCIGFFKPDLFEIIERNPSTGVKIVLRLCEVLGRRLKETGHKITELRNEIQLIAQQSE